eukprot:TRINITY_DN7605_c0_g1_i1.p2 TRINITY_DN7605_c0_g1~~TRINITY_DN7605_c0_g1_i1.p2  ORF type:complete len:60 (+),score=20.06 TRINITY_DN7605_c0_g1_i1:353-532(+)
MNLSRNKIGDYGAKTLAQALQKNSTLTELTLSENKISDHGAKVFGNMAARLRLPRQHRG